MATNTRTSSESPSTREGAAIEVRRTRTVPPKARVRHFDELGERTQQVLAELDGDRSVVPVAEEVAEEVVDDVVVVFTGYYRITRR
ncbi:hypothetical protein [Halomicrococcus gelatinilyticus]|uniref:hypothetical protein n=1 Tax=Halomicrococcus gelatinilyticus TaxID=1702103 RepID=UPI002E1544E7